MVDLAVSDRSLRVLAEAVRAGSLTGAARRLGLSQPAVSHAVAKLEAELGVRLLDRSRHGVEPTGIGAELVESVGRAYRTIDAAVRWAATPQRDGDVSICVSTSLAAWWLLPRLPGFKRRHSGVSLRLTTADGDESVDPETVDLWVPLGPVARPDLRSTPLCDEILVPVASPGLAERVETTGEPSRLLDAPLLHLEERYAARYDWPLWFTQHGVSAPTELGGDRSTDYSLVLQATLDGQGVALGWLHIVSDLLAAGRLVALAPPVVTGQPFTILHHAGRPLSPGADAMRRWLVEEMARGGSTVGVDGGPGAVPPSAHR